MHWTSPVMTDSFLVAANLSFGSPQIVPEGDEALLVHPMTGLRYPLNPTARVIWDSIQQPNTLLELRDRVCREFELSHDDSGEAVRAFLDQLTELGLVEVRDPSDPQAALRRRYLDLLQRALVNLIYPEHELRIDYLEKQTMAADRNLDKGTFAANRVTRDRVLRDIRELEADAFSELIRAKLDGSVYRGRPWRYSHTMVGLRRLEHLHWCATRVFEDGIPGDFLEAGVCQGGAAIFMRALQVAYGEERRLIWAADSFQGLPVPEHEYDCNYDLSEGRQPWLAATLESVRENFRTYDLLSDQVRFLPGWFRDTLPHAPIDRLAILRLDADIYASTMEALVHLYDKVAPGGFVIIDDYEAFTPCRTAVTEFREERGVIEPLRRIDWTAFYWRKAG